MDARGPCEHCHGAGLVTVYHKFFEGSQTVIWEHTDASGEVHSIKSAGTVSAHCLCTLGEWMRSQTKDDLRERIPSLLDVLANRTNYRAIDPTTEMYGPEPTPEAVGFLRKWKRGLARFFPVEVP